MRPKRNIADEKLAFNESKKHSNQDFGLPPNGPSMEKKLKKSSTKKKSCLRKTVRSEAANAPKLKFAKSKKTKTPSDQEWLEHKNKKKLGRPSTEWRDAKKTKKLKKSSEKDEKRSRPRRRFTSSEAAKETASKRNAKCDTMLGRYLADAKYDRAVALHLYWLVKREPIQLDYDILETEEEDLDPEEFEVIQAAIFKQMRKLEKTVQACAHDLNIVSPSMINPFREE